MIVPTVGRKVWYRPSHEDLSSLDNSIGGKAIPPMFAFGDQPLDATILYVHSDYCVNLVVFDHDAAMHRRMSVILSQGDNPVPPGDAYAEWMPYQAAQAKKDEAAA